MNDQTNLKQKLDEAMKDAMRAKEKLKLDTIRMARAAIKQVEIDQRTELDDPGVLQILNKLVKQRKESIRQFQEANRNDLADKEQAEIEILQTFLPARLSEAEISAMIDQAIMETQAQGIKEMSKVMAHLKPKLTGRADMSEVSALIKQKLT